MDIRRTVLAQLMDCVPRYQFQLCVQRYRGDHKIKDFSCWKQWLCMVFAQLTYRESLRDIEATLGSVAGRLYHMGIRGRVARSSLAHTNENRDWQIYADFAQVLIQEARALYAGEPFAVELEKTVYALDSTTIDLCLSVFPWARFRKRKGAIKLHTLLDLRGNIPTSVEVTDGQVHDVNILDHLLIQPGSIYILDRGYLDFARLYRLHQNSGFFIIRSRQPLNFRRRYSHRVDKSTGLRSDQIGVLTGRRPAKRYPEKLRRVRYYDAETRKHFVFLSNNFALPALSVAQLYRCRWQVELFFKWIKQHLRIKAFYGTSRNAVKTQIWIAISVYVLVAILKKRLKLELSLYTILQILSLTVFEKAPLIQVLTSFEYRTPRGGPGKQLNLFDL